MANYTVTDDDQSVTGSAFNDSFSVTGDRDTIMAGEGIDVVSADGFNEVIHGEMGNDRLYDLHAGHSSLLDGGVGDDQVHGYLTDTLIGGDGDDTFLISVTGLASGVDADFGAVGSGSEDLVFSWGELVDFEHGTFGGTTHDDTLRSSGSVDLTLFGDDGNDVIIGRGGQATPPNGGELLIGGAGDDLLVAGPGSAMLYAFDNGGAVELALGVGQAVDSETDHDTLRGGDAIDTLFAGYGYETLIGGGSRDYLSFQYLTHASVNLRLDKGHGSNSDGGHYSIKSVEFITGTPLGDRIVGADGNETINSGDGDDTIIGGLGADSIDGGRGDNVFVYRSAAEADHDQISLFQSPSSCTIDLHAIDAKTDKAGNQTFTKVQAFTHHSGELLITYDLRSDVTGIYGDVDGDGVADFTIAVNDGQPTSYVL